MRGLTIRFEDDVFEELSQLAYITKQSKNSIVNACIRSEYNKYHDDPKIQLALKQLSELAGVVERMNEEMNSLK